MDDPFSDFLCKGVARSGTVALGRGNPPYQGKYILNLKFTKYNRWKLSVWLVCDLGELKLTVITGQFGLLYRQAYYRKVSNQESTQSTMQVSGQILATYT